MVQRFGEQRGENPRGGGTRGGLLGGGEGVRVSGRTVVMDGELVAGAGGIGEETEGSEGSAP